MFIGRFHKTTFPTSLIKISNGNVATDCATALLSDKKKSYEFYFWGRLYNKKKEGLTDTAYAAMLYHEEGEKAFQKMDGIFVIAVIYAEKLIIMRDHHGTGSQVYYNNYFFASSLQLLQKTENFDPTPDYASLHAFLSIGYIATPNTSFQGVQKLQAGSMLIYENGKIHTENVFDTHPWNIPLPKKTLDEYAVEYGELHEKAIQRRINGSQKVGMLLSGGYDSGCNLVALRNIYDGDIHTYSIGFRGDNWSELPLARCMSETFRTTHSEYLIDGSEIKSLPKLVKQLGDPFMEGGLMVNYCAMQMIGDDKPDVILGGDGSDQYFGTSAREVAIHYLTAKYGLSPLLKMLNSGLNQDCFEKDTKLYRLRFHLEKIQNILQGDLFGFPSSLLKNLIKPEFAKQTRPLKQMCDVRSFEHLFLQHAYESDLEKIINQVILFKASKMAEMFGNHLTYPYMDTSLYNFIRNLPIQFRSRGKDVKSIAKGQVINKFLLKYHYKPMLPKMITEKKKQGGFAPMPLFFKDKAQRIRISEFIMNSSVCSEFLNRNEVERFIRQYDSDANEKGAWFWYSQNKAIQYFNLLTLSIWWEQYIKGVKDIQL